MLSAGACRSPLQHNLEKLGELIDHEVVPSRRADEDRIEVLVHVHSFLEGDEAVFLVCKLHDELRVGLDLVPLCGAGLRALGTGHRAQGTRVLENHINTKSDHYMASHGPGGSKKGG